MPRAIVNVSGYARRTKTGRRVRVSRYTQRRVSALELAQQMARGSLAANVPPKAPKPTAPEPNFVPVVGERVRHPGSRRYATITKVVHTQWGTEIEVEWHDDAVSKARSALRKANKELKAAQENLRSTTASTSKATRRERDSARSRLTKAEALQQSAADRLATVRMPERLPAGEFKLPQAKTSGPAKKITAHPDAKPMAAPEPPKKKARLSHPDNPDPKEYASVVKGGRSLDPQTAGIRDLRGAAVQYRVGTQGRWEWGVVLDRSKAKGHLRVAQMSTSGALVQWVPVDNIETLKTPADQKDLWSRALRKHARQRGAEGPKQEILRAREGKPPGSPKPPKIARTRKTRTRHEEALDALGLGDHVTWTSENAVLSGPEGHQEMTTTRSGIVVGHHGPDELHVWDADQKEHVRVHYSRVGKNFKGHKDSLDLENDLFDALQAAEARAALGDEHDRRMRTRTGAVLGDLRTANESRRKRAVKDEPEPQPDWAADWPPRRDHEDAVPSNLRVGDDAAFVHEGVPTTEGTVLENDAANRRLVVWSPTAQRRLESRRRTLDADLDRERQRLDATLSAKPGELSPWSRDFYDKKRKKLTDAVVLQKKTLESLKTEHRERRAEYRKEKRTRGQLAAFNERLASEVAGQERLLSERREAVKAFDAALESELKLSKENKPRADANARKAFAEFEAHYARESKRLDKAIAKREKRITVSYDDVHHVRHLPFDERRLAVESTLADAPKATLNKAVRDVEADKGERTMLVGDDGVPTWGRNPDFRRGEFERHPDAPSYEDDPADRQYPGGAETPEERAAQRAYEEGGQRMVRRKTLANGDFADASVAEMSHWADMLYTKGEVPIVGKGQQAQPMRDPHGTPTQQVKNSAAIKKVILDWIAELPEDTLLRMDDDDLADFAIAASKYKAYADLADHLDYVVSLRKRRLGSTKRLAEAASVKLRRPGRRGGLSAAEHLQRIEAGRRSARRRSAAVSHERAKRRLATVHDVRFMRKARVAALAEATPLAPGGQWQRVVERHYMPDGTVRYVPRLVLIRRFRPRWRDEFGDLQENVGGYTRRSASGKTVAVKGYARQGPKPPKIAATVPTQRTLRQLPLPLTRQEQDRQQKALAEMLVKFRGNATAQKVVRERLKRLDQVAKLAKVLGTTIREAEGLYEQWCHPFVEASTRWRTRGALLRSGLARVGGYTRRQDGKTIRVRAHQRRFDPADMLDQATAHRQVTNVQPRVLAQTGEASWPKPPEGPFERFQAGALKVYLWGQGDQSRLFGALAGSRPSMRDYITRELMTDDELYDALGYKTDDFFAASRVKMAVHPELDRRGLPRERPVPPRGSGKYPNGVYTAPNPGRTPTTRAEKQIARMDTDARIDLAADVAYEMPEDQGQVYFNALSSLSDEELYEFDEALVQDLAQTAEVCGWNEDFIARLDDLNRFGIGERTDPRLGRAGSILGAFLNLDGTDPDHPTQRERIDELNSLSPSQLRTLRNERVGITLSLKDLRTLREEHPVLRRCYVSDNAVGLHAPRGLYSAYRYEANQIDSEMDSEVFAFTERNYSGDAERAEQITHGNVMGPVLLHEIGHALHDLGYFEGADAGEPHWDRISRKKRERVIPQGGVWGFQRVSDPEGVSVYEPVLRPYFQENGRTHGGKEIIAEGYGWIAKLGRRKAIEFFDDEEFVDWLVEHVEDGWDDVEIAEALRRLREAMRENNERSSGERDLGVLSDPPTRAPLVPPESDEPYGFQTEQGLFVDGIGPYKVLPPLDEPLRLTRPVTE